MARVRAVFILTLLAATLAMRPESGFADAITVPVPEAPTTIFATKLGSADVSLSLLGSWTAGLSFGTGILLAPGLPVQLLDSFPALDTGFIFSQTPDITVSLDLLKHYFLDVSILGSFSDNSLQMGYRGGSDEVLHSLILGTKGVTIAPSTFLQVPDQPTGSIGASAELVSGSSTNDLLLRWDAAPRKTKTFVGKHELVEQELTLDSYTKGMYFFLPDVGIDTGSLKVYIEDPNGTLSSSESPSRKYRLATYDDVILDSVNGLVTLRNALKGRVLVYYTKGSPVGTLSNGGTLPALLSAFVRDVSSTTPFSWGMATYLGQTMSTRKVTLPGVGDALLLWQPGDNSPFEIDNSYAFTSTPPSDVSQISITLSKKDVSATLPTNVVFQSIPVDKRFTALQSLTSRTFGNFYPFPDTSGLLYGPDRDSLSGSLGYKIFAQFLTPVDALVLEANIVPGSVQVTVNGMSTTRFEVDAASGKLTLLDDVLPTDRIVVTYEKVDSSSTGGDLVFAWRDTIPLADWATLSFATGIRWNAFSATYSQQAYAKSGTLIAEAGISGKTDTISYSAEAAVSYTNPDTTGILRLFGMEGDSTSISLSEEYAYPASLPDPAQMLIETGISGLGLNQANRGYLYYRDYRTYDVLGNATLHPIELSPAPDRTAYATNGRMGPYNVTGSNGNISAQSLVMEYELSASNPWVGTQLPVSSGTDVDLSGARSLTVRLRGVGISGAVNVYVQIGSISEDLDDSHTLKAEASTTDTGFPFYDAAHSATLKVGAGPKLEGNAILDSEDRNANEILDYEDATRVVTKTDATNLSFNADTSWTSVTLSLSDADRAMLLKARGVRIIIYSATAATGKILIDSISIQGTPFALGASADRTKTTVRQVAEYLSANDPGSTNRLDQKFSSTYTLFHPSGDTNEVLEVLDTATTSTGYAVKGYLTNSSGGTTYSTGGIQYQTIVSYVRSTKAGLYSFSMADATGVRIKWSLTLAADNTWHEVKVHRDGSTVTVDGTTVGAPTQFDASYGDLVSLQVDVPTGAAGTALYLDEVYATDPLGSVGAAFVGNISAKFPGVILSAGSVPLLSNVTIRQDVALYSAGFSSLYGTPASAEDLSSRTHAEGEVLFTRAAVDVTLRDSGGSFTAYGSHKLTFPSVASPVAVTDAFSLTNTGGFSRENLLTLSAGSFMALTVDSTANASPDETDSTGLLTQTWQAALSLNPLAPLTLSSLATLSQAVTGYSLPQDWYGARWARESQLLLPWQGGTDSVRKESLDVKAGLPAAPVGFNAEASASVAGSTYTTAGFTQESDASMSLSLIMKLGQPETSDTSLSLSYGRALTLISTPAAGERFIAETGELARLLSLQGYMLQNVPLLEIFTDNSSAILPAWSSVSQGTYAPSLSVSLQRGYGSNLIDLLIPSSVEIAVGQELEKTSDLSQTLAFIRPKTTTRAVNLFGSLGAYPLFPMVRTDEYSVSLSGSLDGSPTASPILSTLSLEALATLTGLEEQELTFVNTMKRTESTTVANSVVFSNDTQALFNWKVKPSGGVPLWLVPPDIAATGHFEHAESAELTLGYQDTGTYSPLTLVLGHSTSLVFGEHGTIKASLNLGMNAENLGVTGYAWRFAVRAALEAKLTF
jgi:hypothetical protein